MSTKEHQHVRLAVEDRRLVDLLASVLTDPNLHTDTKMRLHQEIGEILHGAHGDVHGAVAHEVHARALREHGGRLPDLLASVLVDPNLHTDTRMRLHHQIAETLAYANQPRGKKWDSQVSAPTS